MSQPQSIFLTIPFRRAALTIFSTLLIPLCQVLGGLTAGFDAPSLKTLEIVQLIFENSQLSQFIGSTEKLGKYFSAHLFPLREDAAITIFGLPWCEWWTSCRRLDWQMPSMVHICGSHPISPVAEYYRFGTGDAEDEQDSDT